MSLVLEGPFVLGASPSSSPAFQRHNYVPGDLALLICICTNGHLAEVVAAIPVSAGDTAALFYHRPYACQNEQFADRHRERYSKNFMSEYTTIH